VLERYRTGLSDFFNVHDLHVGPAGLICSNGPQGQPLLSGPQLAGTPFVNAHYARYLQGWAIQRSLVGQHWDGTSRELRFRPAVLRVGDVLPWYTSEAGGNLRLQGQGSEQVAHSVVLFVSHRRLEAAPVLIETRVDVAAREPEDGTDRPSHSGGLQLPTGPVMTAQGNRVTVSAGEELVLLLSASVAV
jgi:hypothetical protein